MGELYRGRWGKGKCIRDGGKRRRNISRLGEGRQNRRGMGGRLWP